MTPREKLELIRSYRAAGGTGSYISLLNEAKKYAEEGSRNKISNGTLVFQQHVLYPTRIPVKADPSANDIKVLRDKAVESSGMSSNINLEQAINYKAQLRKELSSISKELDYYEPPVKQGIDLKKVIGLQEMLSKNNYDIGKYGVDGKMGKSTIKALQEFLIDNGKNLGKYGADGIIGNLTKKAIDQYNKEVSGTGSSTYAKNNRIGVVDRCEEEQCAAYEDAALEKFYGITAEDRLKAGIFGDAWQRDKNMLRNGGELLYNKDSNISKIDRIQAGDIVNMKVLGSRYTSRAGEYGTHTGIIDSGIEYENNKPFVYVLHNIKGKIMRDKVRLDTGKLNSYISIKSIIKPNVKGKEPVTRIANPNINLELNTDDTNNILNNVLNTFNDLHTRQLFLDHLNIDEKEYFSIAKATMGIINQESGYGNKGKIEMMPNRLELAAKEIGSGIAKDIKTVSEVASLISGKDLRINNILGYDIPKEPSRGWAQIKFDENFNDKDNSGFVLKDVFGINKKDLNSLTDNGRAAAIAAAVIVAKNYNRLKNKYPQEKALYLAIQQYNGFNLNKEVAGKTRLKWAEENNLDYPNKVMNFIDNVSIKDSNGQTYYTMIDKLNLNPEIIKNQARLNTTK